MPPSTGRKRWTHFCRNAIACHLSAFATWIILKSAAIQSLSPDASINTSGGYYRKRRSAECAWCLQTSHENNMAVIDMLCRSLASKSARTRKHLRPIASGSVYPRRRLAGQANVPKHLFDLAAQRGARIFRAVSSAALHHHAAINAKDLASNVICLRGSEKRNRARDIFRLPRFSERNPRFNRFLNVVGQSRRHVGCDKSRCNRIHRDVSARQFARKRFCKTNQAGLARSVIRLTGVADQTDHRANVNNAAAALLNHRALHGLD